MVLLLTLFDLLFLAGILSDNGAFILVLLSGDDSAMPRQQGPRKKGVCTNASLPLQRAPAAVRAALLHTVPA
jgi:hypothetical protein